MASKINQTTRNGDTSFWLFEQGRLLRWIPVTHFLKIRCRSTLSMANIQQPNARAAEFHAARGPLSPLRRLFA
jgi:hypothetical protein